MCRKKRPLRLDGIDSCLSAELQEQRSEQLVVAHLTLSMNYHMIRIPFKFWIPDTELAICSDESPTMLNKIC